MTSASQPVRKVVIVGGGTAGWLTAGRIAAEHATKAHHPVEVVLVESPNIPTIGVGEGTWPTMRNTLIKLGIRETDFIRECDASFKQGAKFAGWVTGDTDDFYYHPLMLPQGFSQGNLGPYWQQHQDTIEQSFSNAVCFQEALCEHNRAPKSIRHAEFGAVANYAYHLDAGKFTSFLTRHCTEKLNVRHVLADVTGVTAHDNGDIRAIQTQQAGEIGGDLFVDCTGFQSLLLGKHYKVPFVPCDDVLFIDRALAVHVPYDSPDAPVATHTISTAQQAGWIWDIGLQSRRGVGHVYASRYQSEQQALDQLAQYVGPQFNDLSVKQIQIQSGHREHFWHNNCVAVGLSAGFLEPLEASALVLVELSATMLAEQLPVNRATMPIIAKRFNQTFQYRWQRIIDFLKLHYMLTKRTDTAFWRDNCDPATIPDSLQELLDLWRYHPPYDHDFTSNNEVFPAASYQYVMYGMGFESDLSFGQQQVAKAFAQQQLQMNQQARQKVLSALPTHRDLLNKINQYGLQPV
ncbi:MAG: tryptophan halogenase [Alteromonadaceae bacterium]|nr:tryptophan halogenase [Alteromonadaceae bacterium]